MKPLQIVFLVLLLTCIFAGLFFIEKVRVFFTEPKIEIASAQMAEVENTSDTSLNTPQNAILGQEKAPPKPWQIQKQPFSELEPYKTKKREIMAQFKKDRKLTNAWLEVVQKPETRNCPLYNFDTRGDVFLQIADAIIACNV